MAAFLVAAFLVFGVLLQTRAYFPAFATLIIAAVAAGIYLIGESSDLPGTSGDKDKNVPT